jgi:hypothetical protein
MQQLFCFSRRSVFSSAGGRRKTGAYIVFSSASEADETNFDYFHRSLRPKKQYLFRRLCWPTKRNVFSSVADENAFIFIDFIPLAYFYRPTNEYIYFRWFSSYFRRFLADEIKLFFCVSLVSLASYGDERPTGSGS